MRESETQVLAWILKAEGGFIEAPSEPGGAANMGITLRTFRDWRALKHGPEPTILDLKVVTLDEVTEIYRYKYFHPIRFDELPIGVDYCTADAAVHSGPTGSIRFLQEALGFKLEDEYPNWTGHLVDGNLGISTMWAVKNRDQKALIRECINVRRYRQEKILERKVRHDSTYPANQWRGIWSRRNTHVLERSLDLLEKSNGDKTV